MFDTPDKFTKLWSKVPVLPFVIVVLPNFSFKEVPSWKRFNCSLLILSGILLSENCFTLSTALSPTSAFAKPTSVFAPVFVSLICPFTLLKPISSFLYLSVITASL